MTAAEVRECVRAGGLLSSGYGFVAMLSGGRDSVCLLDVAVALRGAGQVHALHVNYGLRAESDEDERHCRELCERLGVGIEVVQASRAEQASGNLHAWARELRYAAAHELAQRLDERRDAQGGGSLAGTPPVGEAPAAEFYVEGDGVSKHDAPPARAGHRPFSTSIATGHTATDQVETILYRLAASPGRRALLGMAASEGRIVRPLLGLTRQDTAAYCTELKLAWHEDSSNDNPLYARARVRHGLVKALDAVHPAAQANVLRTAALLREETELLDALVDAELEAGASIAIERLKQLAPALQRLVVIRLAEEAGGEFAPRAGERVDEILALGARGGRAELHVGGLAGAVIEDGELRMVAIQPREQRPPHPSTGTHQGGRAGECEASPERGQADAADPD
ncbi:MAG TPA: tRNA lysidine(34) synthetase [Solirubrobacteraceae bacterium]|jgi:tRNA(Ile)-lysidine synthase|nr:tRNA lysidine(34) synthetase [Solirubrobacteraceae bacterium]